MDDSFSLRLERCDPAKRMLRFYALQVAPNLFGEWCLLRTWGRIGRGGQLRMEWFATKEEAVDAFQMLETAKRNRGYRERQQMTSVQAGEECHFVSESTAI